MWWLGHSDPCGGQLARAGGWLPPPRPDDPGGGGDTGGETGPGGDASTDPPSDSGGPETTPGSDTGVGEDTPPSSSAGRNCTGGCAKGPWGKTGGPQPPVAGGGAGYDPSGTPARCFGGSFGEYSDNDSFCAYVANRWRYLENECGNFGTATLTQDPSLMTLAQAEAKEVANGACPKGGQECGGWAEMLYIDGYVGKYLAKDAMFTVPESELRTSDTPSWFYKDGGVIYPTACQFVGELPNVMLYHYCNWEGTGKVGDPSTQPKRVGCGTAVDKSGVTWRVVKLGK